METIVYDFKKTHYSMIEANLATMSNSNAAKGVEGNPMRQQDPPLLAWFNFNLSEDK